MQHCQRIKPRCIVTGAQRLSACSPTELPLGLTAGAKLILSPSHRDGLSSDRSAQQGSHPAKSSLKDAMQQRRDSQEAVE